MNEVDTIRDTTIVQVERIDCHGMTSPGRVHALNADALLVADLTPYLQQPAETGELNSGQLLVVADGVGREWLGQRASSMAIEFLRKAILTTSFPHPASQRDDDQLALALQRTVAECQDRLRRAAEQTADLAGMGTTLTAAYIAWPRLVLLHVGDSRCYLHRITYLDRLTTDHTVAERMISEGYVNREQLQQSRWHNVLWNTISASRQDATPELRRLRLRVGDSLLLCTDGLTRHLSERQIREALQEGTSARRTCEQLIEMANARGGEDNITVVVASFHHGSPVSGDASGWSR
jgi:PPM family protein phosphatase